MSENAFKYSKKVVNIAKLINITNNQVLLKGKIHFHVFKFKNSLNRIIKIS